jgi:hypothetical protein
MICEEVGKGILGCAPVETDEPSDEQPEALRLLRRLPEQFLVTDPAGTHHPFQRFQVRGGELAPRAQPVDGQVPLPSPVRA